jgi:hypothetical protein
MAIEDKWRSTEINKVPQKNNRRLDMKGYK